MNTQILTDLRKELQNHQVTAAKSLETLASMFQFLSYTSQQHQGEDFAQLIKDLLITVVKQAEAFASSLIHQIEQTDGAIKAQDIAANAEKLAAFAKVPENAPGFSGPKSVPQPLGKVNPSGSV